jgi:hypothetical protein
MEEKRSTGEVLLQAAIVLAAQMAAVWAVLPPQERMWVRLRAAQVSRRVLGGLAAREGRAGMRDEVAGRDPSLRYTAAFRLGTWRDWLEEAMRQ